MREMKDSGIEWVGMIPKDWQTSKIKYVCKFSPRSAINFINSETEVSYAPMECIKNGYSTVQTALYGTIPKSLTPFENGDIVMAKVTPCFENGNIAIMEDLTSGIGFGSSELFVFRATSINTKYLFYWLRNNGFVQAAAATMMGTGGLKRISPQFVQNTLICVPSLSEQEKISNYLDSKCSEIDALSADIQTEIDILEQYKKSIVYNAVRHGIRKSRNLSPVNSDVWNDLPDGWKLVDIKYLFEIVKRVAGKEGYNVLSVTQNGLKIKDITSGDGQLANNYSNYQFVYPTDYVMNHMDLLTGWVDLSSMFGVTSPDYRVFRLRNKKENDCSYFKYVMQCCYMNRIFYSLGQGVSNLGRWRLQTSTFNNFKVPVPPIEEQKEISTYLDAKISDVNSTIAEKHKQIEILTNYKKSLIYEYVTGKKEIPATNTNNVVAINPQAILLGGIVKRIGNSQHGRTQLQKLLYLCNAHFGMNQNIQYYRYEHGPYDIHLNDYIRELVKNQWFNEKAQDKNCKNCILVSGKKWKEFEENYPNPFGEKKQEIGNLFKQLKDLSTRQIERIATLYAAWNDFLLDGITPSDDQIIQDVITNWTANKANFQYTTWQDSLNQMKQYGLIPKGTGLHTLPKP